MHEPRLRSRGLCASRSVFKEVLTVVSSVVFLGEVLTYYKACGLALCTLGIALYNLIKFGHHAAGRDHKLSATPKNLAQTPSSP